MYFPINYNVGTYYVITYVECDDNESYLIADNTVKIKTTIPTNILTKHIKPKNIQFSIKFLNTKGKALKKY